MQTFMFISTSYVIKNQVRISINLSHLFILISLAFAKKTDMALPDADIKILFETQDKID